MMSLMKPDILLLMKDQDCKNHPRQIRCTICEDAWQHSGETPSDYNSDPISQIMEWGRQGVNLDATVNLSASPYHANKAKTRIDVARSAAKSLNHPFLLANQVGGNDDLLFDGRSIVAWPNGDVVIAPAWKEGIMVVDLEGPDKVTWIGDGDLQIISPNETLELSMMIYWMQSDWALIIAGI